MNIIEQWQALDTSKQLDWLRSCIIKAARREIDGDLQGFINFHGLDGLANDAWLKLTERMSGDYIERQGERREAEGRPEITINAMVYRAAWDTVRAARRSDSKHQHDTLTFEDGDGGEYIGAASRRADETEIVALGRMILEEFTGERDEIDKLIIETIRDGYSKSQAATAANITPAAITKRLKKLREALRKELAA